jgi:transcriptional regulator with XRE-family HTH domain
MFIANRLRKIREIRGWKQASVAQAMHTTQQSYSSLEQGTGFPKIETLNRYCDVMEVTLHFLMSEDVPVTEENLERYGNVQFADLINEVDKLEQRLEIFNSILLSDNKSLTMNNLRTKIIAA